jgi:TetR/AcrR family transcriptional regulator of autoinduction and epiphytic fitness
VIPSSTAAAGGAGGRRGPDLGDALPGFPSPDASGALPWADEPATDGRLARGQRTRRNVADALAELLAEGDPDPTAKAIAQRAGVSLRLVFHHFSDMDDLYLFVSALQFRRQWADLPQLSPKLALATRIDRTVAHRSALFEEISPLRRAAVRRAPTSPSLGAAIASADLLLLESLKATFTPELDALPENIRAEHLEAMDTATSWEAWERMRRTSGLTVRAAKRVMGRTLAALCVDSSLAARRRDPVAAAAS